MNEKVDCEIQRKVKAACDNIVVDVKTSMYNKISDVRLWRSSKGNWLLTYKSDYTTYGKALCEKEVENILIQYDLEMYEQIFGEVEEA